MSGRLAEIEARAADLLSHFGPPDCATANWIPTDVDVLVARVCDDDVPLLIAHIHALEAQAALDATVVEAAMEYRDAEAAMEEIRQADLVTGERYVYDHERAAARERKAAAKWQLLAALAARKGMT